MSWLYSRVLVEEFLVDTCLDGEQFAPLNGNPIPQAYCAPDKMTDFSRLSRYGMTYKPLTESRGEELLTLYREGFPVRTSQLQERGTAWTESAAGCGERWRASFAKYNPSTHSLRTPQCSLFEDSTESCVTLLSWGLMRDGECWEQLTLERLTKGTGYGLSQEMWPTPATKGYAHAAEGMVGNLLDKIDRGVISKQEAEQMLSLPHLENHRTTKRKWGTPKVQDSRHALRDRGKGNLGEQVSGMHDGGKLNPLWTEWLMGWWIGWTDLKPLEMDKSLSVQPPHGTS